MTTEFVLVRDLIELEFARIALVSALLVGAICGLLSPLVVYKQRSYIGDTLAHLVFPGVVVGLALADVFALSSWASMFIGAAITAVLGSFLSEKIHARSRFPHDSVAVTVLTGFFAIGILIFAANRGRLAAIDFEQILFGDILALSWNDAFGLLAVLLVVTLSLVYLRRDFECWVTDADFAEIAGYRTRQLEMLFPVLVTLTVLASMFAVGVLLVSSLLALPTLLVRPRTILSLRSIMSGIFVTFFGLAIAFQFDLPVGATIVAIGLAALSAKYLMFTK